MKTRAEKLIEKMMDEYPYGVFSVETAFEFIENGGQVDTSAFRIWMKANGYWRDYFTEEPDDVLKIKRSELDTYLQKYGISTEEELDKKLWYEYGVTLKILD